MTKPPRLLAFAFVAVASMAAAQPGWAAKDPSCSASKWTLTLEPGLSDASAVIAESAEEKIWRVGVGGIPANAMLIIESKRLNGTMEELVLNPGAAQLVNAASVTMHLQRASAKPGKIVIAGSYNVKCGK